LTFELTTEDPKNTRPIQQLPKPESLQSEVMQLLYPCRETWFQKERKDWNGAWLLLLLLSFVSWVYALIVT
jgi:hypothetical protein